MNSELERYSSLLDALREQRQSEGWMPEHDRALLERIDDLFETLDDASQDTARASTWRGWPDQFAARLETKLVEGDVDPDNVEAAARPPRRMAA